MKQLYLHLLICALILCFTSNTFSQVGIGTSTPKPEALLDIESINANTGILFPRVDIPNLNALAPIATSSAEEGLLVYTTNQTTGKGFYYWNGIDSWLPVGNRNRGLQFFSYNSGIGAEPSISQIVYNSKPNKSGRFTGSLHIPSNQFATSSLKPSNNDGFTIKLVGYYEVKNPGEFHFRVTSDDGTRIFIDDALVYDHWEESNTVTEEDSVELSKGKHKIEFWYYENQGNENFHFEWQENPDNLPESTMTALQFTID